MPLRSRIRPRFGTTGTTEVRLFSACSLRSVCRYTCRYTRRIASSRNRISTARLAASTRARNRERSASTFLSSVIAGVDRSAKAEGKWPWREWLFPGSQQGALERPILVRIRRAALRGQQDDADDGPQRGFDHGREQKGHTGEHAATDGANGQLDGVHREEQRQHLHRLRRHREPEQAAVDGDGEEAQGRVRQCMLP